ncbi:MAG: DUF6130 family protein [Candidatus Binatia bacterium]
MKQAIDESFGFRPVILTSLWLALASALAEPLDSRGVVGIHYCSENLHIVPVFRANALTVSPRAGHIHVRVDDASWVWADASGLPTILQGLLPGPHKVLIESIIPRSLLRAQNSWGFQRGLNIPLVASGVHTPIAKCSVDLVDANHQPLD